MLSHAVGFRIVSNLWLNVKHQEDLGRGRRYFQSYAIRRRQGQQRVQGGDVWRTVSWSMPVHVIYVDICALVLVRRMSFCEYIYNSSDS